jgi:hypothetical protein
MNAGPPEALENCSIHNRSDTWLHVECDPGFDGGSAQEFVMELWNPDFGTLVRRIVSETQPSFTVGNLDEERELSEGGGAGGREGEQGGGASKRDSYPGVAKLGSSYGAVGRQSVAGMSLLVVLYSRNAKGQSQKATLEARMPQVMENRMNKGQLKCS